MKKKTVFLLVFFIYLILPAKSFAHPNDSRQLHDRYTLRYCNLGLRVTNYCRLGTIEAIDSGLLYPNLYDEDQTELLYKSGLWVGAVKCRRNSLGELLYWLPDPQNENDVIPASDPDWTPDLDAVYDTLTTTGWEGDLDLMEMLPAYNPLEFALEQYDHYNTLDNIITGHGMLPDYDDDLDMLVDEDDLGRPFILNDPYQNWCFTIPSDDDGDGWLDEDYGHPGYETTLSYSYDYSPFGTDGDRDWGNWHNSSYHIPLGIAVKQQTWSYPVLGLEDIVFVNWKITNSSQIDTLKYLCLGLYLDSDVGPVDWDVIYDDDASSYNNDPDYEYAWSYDYDADGGLSTAMLGARILDIDYGVTCWTWQAGDGPDDTDPLDFNPSAATANEKYWLMNYRNPDEDKYACLRDYPNAQTSPLDTRFLYSIYGAMPHTGDMNNNGEPDYLETDENGNFFLRCNLAPLADKVVTAALFVGESTAELDQKCQTALEFHNSGYDLSPYFGEPAMPVIYDIANNDHRIQVMWDLFSDPDELTLLYKDTESTQWLSVDITPYHTQYICEEITNEGIYQFKLAADFDDVYLETVPVEYYFDPASINVHNELIASQTLGVYPNPFNPSTTVFWKQDEDCNTTIDIYNLKGQKVRTLTNQLYSTGNHTLTWNGCDTSGNICPSGIYLIKLNNSTQSLTRKALLLK